MYRIGYRTGWIASALVLIGAGGSRAWADDPAHTKAPEVSTIGTGAYTGPVPEELSKLALVEAAPAASPTQAKEAEASTVTPGDGTTLSEEALAKMTALLSVPMALPLPVPMLKLEPMQVAEEGIPQLTPQEREKRAQNPPAPRAKAVR